MRHSLFTDVFEQSSYGRTVCKGLLRSVDSKMSRVEMDDEGRNLAFEPPQDVLGGLDCVSWLDLGRQ